MVGEKWRIWKISRGKVTKFSEVAKFFPDESFLRLFFPDKVFTWYQENPTRKIRTNQTTPWKIPTYAFKCSDPICCCCLLMVPLSLLLVKFNNGHYYNPPVGSKCFYLYEEFNVTQFNQLNWNSFFESNC